MISNQFIEALLSIATSEIGVHEVGNNGGKQVREYQSSTWLEPGAWPWCAAFVCWCIAKASKAHPLPFALPNTPRAFEFIAWGDKHLTSISKPRQVVRGDIVIFRFGSQHHIGFVTVDSKNGVFQSVEGNTDATGGREGDGVYLRSRSLSTVLAVVAWNHAKKVK